MNKKLPFGVKILKKPSLFKLIEEWMKALDIDVFIHQQYFKYFPRFIIEVEKQFTINSMKYALLKRFPLLVQEKSEEDLLLLSSRIKQAYALININIIMKLDSYFYFLSIFLTKVITQFLKDTFLDIEIDRNLQSEIYIILVFVIIGLEVAPKTYDINHKKIIYEKYLIRIKPKSLCKLETLQTFHEKSSSNKLTPFKGVRKIMMERKWTNVSCKEEPIVTPLDEFKQNLKENLAVKALPKLMKKKIKGCDFDYNADKHEAEMKGDEKKYIFLRESESIAQPTQEFINSNQNSSSFDYLFRNNTEKRFFIHRNVKISHRTQLLVNNKNLKNQHFLKGALETPQLKNEQFEDEKTNKNWKGIIKQIRQHAFETNKINNFIHNEEGSLYTERSKNFQIIRNSQALLTKQVQQEQEEKQCVLVPRTTNFGSYWVHEKQQPFTDLQKQIKSEYHRASTHKLRRQRHFFDQSCEKRHHEAHSSMFNIVNPAHMSLHT